VPDVIAARLDILFVGINPGLYSGAIGHHFARPGNRFWPALAAAGLTPRHLAPHEERELLKHRLGITNIVNRSTASAAELSEQELLAGGRRLRAKLRRYRPRLVAVLGVQAYAAAFRRKPATIGRQPEPLAGCPLWVLPNPSGLNASYQAKDFARLFRRLRVASQASPASIAARSGPARHAAAGRQFP
jgi:TDG/mug DNA glycosylase family protein